ncbi:MAG: universal stress protein, partial [Gammaproteobacteria bacterium]|nr:universal stress protein [Gammaproteobacteria bacterium]
MRVILVPVADRPECAQALQVAFELGKRVGASIHGCHMRPHRYSAVTLSSELPDAVWRRKTNNRTRVKAKNLYAQIAKQNGYEIIRRPRIAPGALWTERVGSPDKLMSIVGPVADLIVVSRPAKRGGVAEMFLTTALFGSARPVLLLPPAGRRNIGRRVCIGWNQSPEASLAVTAALPILQSASDVTIVSCGPEIEVGPKSSQIAAYLKHWGINSNRVRRRGRDVNAELLAACKEARADLLICGAYSRNRWRERIFGGTTEFLIRKARIPVM